MAEIVAVALGSNLGDREQTMRLAVQRMADHPMVSVNRVSPFVETQAVGMTEGTPPFLNGVALLLTELSPWDLLVHLELIEHNMGRVLKGKNESRPIDLDIIFYGNQRVQDLTLQIPHPRYHARPFVIDPLLAVWPDAIDPVLLRRVSALPTMRWSTVYHRSHLEAVAQHLFQLLPRPAVIAVRGDMGVGKTTLIRSVSAHCGVMATSPTFDIIRSYPHAPIPFLHVDLYRIPSALAFDSLDLLDYIPHHQLAFIEWPDHAGGGLQIDYDLSLEEIDTESRQLILTKASCV